MTIQVDPIASPRIITVPEADGASITVQSLVNQIRNWEDNQANLAYPRLLSATGKDDLGGGTLVGITAVLENTRLRFEERGIPTTCFVGGGNLVAIDAQGDSIFPIEPSTNVTVQLSQSSSATLIQSDVIAAIKVDMAIVKQIEQGRWKIANNQMTLYDTDGITPLRIFDLKDKQGQATETNPYERIPV